MVKHLSKTAFCKFLYFITFLKFSSGSDTLLYNQTIANGQTLISPNQVFELGFFAPGTSRNRYFLGIWYRNTPDVVAWVANRNDPITDPQGVLLNVSRNGTLVISMRGSVIWSSTSLGVASDPIVQLLDTRNPILRLLDSGNLVIVDNTSVSSSDSYIWQSFDYPCDTRLPGMKMVDDMDAGMQKYLTSWRSSDDPSPGDFVFKIENHGLGEMVTLRGRSKILRTGPWNGLYFSASLTYPSQVYNPDFVFHGERLISVALPYDSSTVTRVTIEPSGLVQTYAMNERRDKWNLVFPMPRDPCGNYGHCGPYGICRIEKAPMCECFNGYSPRSKKDWDTQDWSGGCSRNRPFNCHSGDGFVEFNRVKFPDMLQFWLNTSISLSECRAACLRNCTCTAYANPYITNGGTGCLMWFGDLIDTRDIPGADARQKVYVRVPYLEMDSGTHLMNLEKKRPKRLILIISTASGVLVIGLICGVILLRIRQMRKAAKKKNEDLELPLFKLATIAAATNNFSLENMIGEGGFGPVYKGSLLVEEEIAVKRLSKTSGQGLEEFKTEVSLIAKLQHRNLVRLLGCCIEGKEMMLIYEFLQNKSLDYFVFDQKRRVLLTWPNRFGIIMGIARGLLYLHHDSRLKIIHRDLKTSNILLDGDLNPKISDFGLARTFGLDQTIARTKRIVGTYGYMSPEYAFDGKFSIKSDIFSLGVVMLEIVSGRRNRGLDHGDQHHSLLGHAWLLWKENKVLELMDECLNDSFVESEVKRCIQVGLLCVQRFAQNRPTMSSVLSMLGNDEVVLPEPKEPGYFIERSCSSTPSKMSEKLTITITEIVGR